MVRDHAKVVFLRQVGFVPTHSVLRIAGLVTSSLFCVSPQMA